MSSDSAEPTNAELVGEIFDRCEDCGGLVGPGGNHGCKTRGISGERSANAAEKRALRDAEDRPDSTAIVTKRACGSGSAHAYHKRHPPSGAPEPDCRVRHDHDDWEDSTIGGVRQRAYPCRLCWPRFREVFSDE